MIFIYIEKSKMERIHSDGGEWLSPRDSLESNNGDNPVRSKSVITGWGDAETDKMNVAGAGLPTSLSAEGEREGSVLLIGTQGRLQVRDDNLEIF